MKTGAVLAAIMPQGVVSYLKASRLCGWRWTLLCTAAMPSIRREFERNNRGLAPTQIALRENILLNILQTRRFDFDAYALLAGETYWELEHFLHHTRKCKVVYDVGAACGVFSLACAAVNRDVVVHAFEPSEEAFADLSSHLSMNPQIQGKIVPLQIGLGERSGVCSITMRGDQAMVVGKVDMNPAIDGRTAELVTMDEYIVGKDPPDAIKIDVEGFEMAVLLGARKAIQTWKPVLFLELHPTLLPAYGSSVLDVLNLLDRWGYEPVRPFRKQGYRMSRRSILKYQFVRRVAFMPRKRWWS